MDDLVQKFLDLTPEKFEFLETEYGYKRISPQIESEKDIRDGRAVIRYSGSAIGIEVIWAFASASINVSFVEMVNGKIPFVRNVFQILPGISKSIDLFTYLSMKCNGDFSEFQLGDVESVDFRSVKKRAKKINDNMEGILDNLSNLTQKWAHNILLGDLSEFPATVEYKKKITKEHNPYFDL